MNRNLDELARQIRLYGIILSYSRGDYVKIGLPCPIAPAWLKQAIRSHRRGLARLMAAGDVRICPNPDLHRASWFYAGRGRFACSLCQRLDAHQLGLWSATA